MPNSSLDRAKSLARRALRVSAAYGVDPLATASALRGTLWFIADLRRYNRAAASFGLRAKLADLYPVVSDRFATAGSASGHYFHQDLWVARQIFRQGPRRHVDIGSRVDGFVSHLLVFRDVEVVDIRPLTSKVPGLSFICDDATQLARFADDSLESVSSLHAGEHFGLGRYGDPIDPDAWLKFARNLARVLSPGGHLYWSVPCGRQRVEFNAHRVFDPGTILEAFSPLRLLELHGIRDNGELQLDIPPLVLAAQEYGCGVFHFTK